MEKGFWEPLLKDTLKDAYIEGYRKMAITAGVIYNDSNEKEAIEQFNNYFENKYSVNK